MPSFKISKKSTKRNFEIVAYESFDGLAMNSKLDEPITTSNFGNHNIPTRIPKKPHEPKAGQLN